jgi:hypothetical protein
MRRIYFDRNKPDPADKIAKARVLAAMPENLADIIGSIRVTYNGFGVNLKRAAKENAHAMAYDIAEIIEATMGQPCRISVYRPCGDCQEIIYQRFLPRELKGATR